MEFLISRTPSGFWDLTYRHQLLPWRTCFRTKTQSRRKLSRINFCASPRTPARYFHNLSVIPSHISLPLRYPQLPRKCDFNIRCVFLVTDAHFQGRTATDREDFSSATSLIDQWHYHAELQHIFRTFSREKKNHSLPFYMTRIYLRFGSDVRAYDVNMSYFWL